MSSRLKDELLGHGTLAVMAVVGMALYSATYALVYATGSTAGVAVLEMWCVCFALVRLGATDAIDQDDHHAPRLRGGQSGGAGDSRIHDAAHSAACGGRAGSAFFRRGVHCYCSRQRVRAGNKDARVNVTLGAD